jgi:hypothetical protein
MEKYPLTRVSRNVTAIDNAMSMRFGATSLDGDTYSLLV